MDGLSAEEVALELLRQGLWPIPLHPLGAMIPQKGGHKISKGKEPIATAWGKSPPAEGKLRAIFTGNPGAGVGIQLGPEAGLIDLEVDGPQGENSLARLFDGEFIETMGWSSRRGAHRLFRYDPRLEALGKKIKLELKQTLPGLEIRKGHSGKQAQSACPPTCGEDGVPRRWNGCSTIAALPDVVVERLLEYSREESRAKSAREAKGSTRSAARSTVSSGQPGGANGAAQMWFDAALSSEAAKVEMAPDGTRHDTLRNAAITLAGQIHFGYLNEAEICAVLSEAVRKAALPDGEIRETLHAGINYGKDHPLPWPEQLSQLWAEHLNQSEERPRVRPCRPDDLQEAERQKGAESVDLARGESHGAGMSQTDSGEKTPGSVTYALSSVTYAYQAKSLCDKSGGFSPSGSPTDLPSDAPFYSDPISKAIARSVPGVGEDLGRGLHDLARHIEGLKPDANDEERKQYVNRWCDACLAAGHKVPDFEKIWTTFEKKRKKIKVPFGQKLTAVAKHANKVIVPEMILKKEKNAKGLVSIARIFIALHELERDKEGRIFIPLRTLQEVTRTNYKTAHRRAGTLGQLGYLELVESGNRARGQGAKANTYRWHDPPIPGGASWNSTMKARSLPGSTPETIAPEETEAYPGSGVPARLLEIGPPCDHGSGEDSRVESDPEDLDGEAGSGWPLPEDALPPGPVLREETLALFHWEKLASLRWGQAVGYSEPGIVNDRGSRGRTLAALQSAASDQDDYAIEERSAIQSLEREQEMLASMEVTS
jgi:hypothetical protein